MQDWNDALTLQRYTVRLQVCAIHRLWLFNTDFNEVLMFLSDGIKHKYSGIDISDLTPSWSAAEPCSQAPVRLCWSHHQPGLWRPPVLPHPRPHQRPAASETQAPGGRWLSQAPGDETQTGLIFVVILLEFDFLVVITLTRTSGRGCVDDRLAPSGE